MFEKEAEKIAERKISNFIPQQWGVSLIRKELTWETVEGAPHFYLNSLAKMWQEGAEFGYNKVNEWHYPSKDELPKCDEETQLIFYVNCYYEVGGETKIRKRTVLGFYKKSFINDDVKLFVERSKGYEEEHLPKDVIAWKEIVLPEPPKESE